MGEFIAYLLCFGFVYLIYFFLIIGREKKRAMYRTSMEVLYLEEKYKINTKKINSKQLAQQLALANAFIIANTVLLISFIDNLVIKILVGFVVLIPMILIVYHLIGTYYQRKEVK